MMLRPTSLSSCFAAERSRAVWKIGVRQGAATTSAAGRNPSSFARLIAAWLSAGSHQNFSARYAHDTRASISPRNSAHPKPGATMSDVHLEDVFVFARRPTVVVHIVLAPAPGAGVFFLGHRCRTPTAA